MSRRVNLMLLMLIIITQSFAQISVSFNVGFNHNNIMYSDYLKNTIPSNVKDIKTGPLNSYCFGGLINYELNKKLSLQSGLFYTGKGGTISLTYLLSTTFKVVPNDIITPFYLELPLNFVYKYRNFQLYVGPYLNLGVSGKTTITGELVGYGNVYDQTRNIKYGTTDSADLRPFNYGLNFGIGYRYNNFLLKVQYQIGKTDLRVNLPAVSIGSGLSTPPINQTYLLFSSTISATIGYVLFENKTKKSKKR